MKQHVLYRHYDSKDVLLYVGISNSFFERLCGHRNHSHWFERIAYIKLSHFENQKAVLDAEKRAIKSEKPLFNAQHSEILKIKPNPVYTIKKISEKSGINRRTLYRMIENGKFPIKPIKGTKPRLWNSVYVDEWIATRNQG